MAVNSLGIAAKEQTVTLANGMTADIKFDPFYYRWYANYYSDGELVACGVALDPNTAGVLDILPVSLGVVDTGDPKVKYEPYEQLGNRLAVIEIVEE